MGEAMKDDGTLLTEYVTSGSEEAFRELVARHAGLVFTAARRQVGSDAMAEEVAQAVFCILARKAKSLQSRNTITGWLHLTTRHTAMKAVRTELRRQSREQEAMAMDSNEADSIWTDLEPHLDEALARLPEADRDLLILRYFEGLALSDVGARLSVNANTAHKRISRALERLRTFLAKRGITVSVGVIASLLPTNAIGSVPSGLLSTLQGTTAAAASTSILPLINETMNHLFWIKLKTALPVAVVGIAAVGTPLAMQHRAIADLQTENSQLSAMLVNNTDSSDFTAGPDVSQVTDPGPTEIHRLRAELTQLKEELRSRSAQVDQLQATQKELRSELGQTTLARDKAENFIAGLKEDGIIGQRINERKILGVSYRRAVQEGVLIRSMDDLFAASGLSKKAREKIRSQTVFFDHGTQTDDPARRMILADREPLQKRDGSQLWFITFMDSSVQMSTQPPPADGVYKAGNGISNLD